VFKESINLIGTEIVYLDFDNIISTSRTTTLGQSLYPDIALYFSSYYIHIYVMCIQFHNDSFDVLTVDYKLAWDCAGYVTIKLTDRNMKDKVLLLLR
jgi:hypothetical protein